MILAATLLGVFAFVGVIATIHYLRKLIEL